MSDEIELLAKASSSILEYKSELERKYEDRVVAENIAAAKNFAEEREITEAFSQYLKIKESILKHTAVNEDKDKLHTISSELNLSDVLESKRKTIENALEIVLEKLYAQTAAVFLIDKDGLLKRFALVGYDSSGHRIQMPWYDEERYERKSNSFVGSAAIPREGSRYGKTQYTRNLSDEPNLSLEGKQKYVQRCGSLNSAIAIPLYGRGKIHGVLRVVNKVHPETRKPDKTSVFDSYDDVVWLSLLANNISNVLSDFAWRVQAKVLSHFYHALSVPPDLVKYYRKSVDLLVQTPETFFKAAILRIFDPEDEELKVVATSLSDDLVGKRKNVALKLGSGMAGWVAENRQHLILHQIRLENELVKFRDKDWINQEWIRVNNFQAFGCFPLISENKILGTLSFYTRCAHNFYEDLNELTFLKSVTELIATFTLLRVMRDTPANAEKNKRVLSALWSDVEDRENRGIHVKPLDYQDIAKAVESALRDKKFDFRTARGIARSLERDEAEVASILEKGEFVRKALIRDRNGENLYTHKKRKRNLREFIAVGQRIMSLPFYGDKSKL